MFRAQPFPLAFAVALLAPAYARAQSKTDGKVFTTSIEYVAPSTCPKIDDFKAIVTGRLGFDPFSDDAPRHVFVSIAAGERMLDGRVEWRDEKGNFAGDQAFPVHKDDCTELVRTMGFALAVQINLLMAEQPRAAADARTRGDASNAGSPAKKAAATSAVAPKPSEDAEAASASGSNESRNASRSGERWAFALGAGGSLGLGLLPKATGLVRVFGHAAFGHAELELGGELSTKVSEDRADGAGFTVQAWLASAAVCGLWGPWSVCALGKGGAVNVEGERVDVPASPSGKVFLAGIRLGARQRVGSTFFFAERLEGLASLTRWTVTLDQVPVWTAPPLAGTVGVDVGAIFE